SFARVFVRPITIGTAAPSLSRAASMRAGLPLPHSRHVGILSRGRLLGLWFSDLCLPGAGASPATVGVGSVVVDRFQSLLTLEPEGFCGPGASDNPPSTAPCPRPQSCCVERKAGGMFTIAIIVIILITGLLVTTVSLWLGARWVKADKATLIRSICSV